MHNLKPCKDVSEVKSPGSIAAFISAAAIGVSLLASSSTIANAQARPDSRAMTCEQVQNMIDQRGSVVVTTGRFTFEKYVKNRRGCSLSQITTIERIPTRDSNRCPVRKCISINRDNGRS